MSYERGVRHACLGCGGSCRGVNVRPVDEQERLRLVDVAARLGVVDPLVDGRLRRVEGGCVFLDGDGCRIHAELGPEHKPTVCGQYPLVAVQTEDGLRVGIDPGCYRHVSTWRTAEALQVATVRAGRMTFPADVAAMEGAALAVIGRSTSLVDVLAGLVGAPSGALPPGFAAATVRRLDGLAAVRGEDSAGASFRRALEPVELALPGWRAQLPGAPVLDEGAEAYALDAVRRVVDLRLLHHLGSPFASAFLTTAGAVVVGWASPEREAFGAGLAAWVRGLRAGPFLRMLMGEGDGLRSWVMESAGPR